MWIRTVAQIIFRKCGKRKPPSKNHNPFVEFFSVDLSLHQNSRTESPPPSRPLNSSPSSPDISPSSFANKLSSPHSPKSKSSSVASSPRSSTALSPRSPDSVKTLPAAWHSRMIPNSNQQGSPKPVLVDHLLELERDRLTEAFRIIDRNRDGKISEEDLGAMWKRLGNKISSKELRLMIQEADKNGDGVLDLEEFLEFFTGMGVQPEIDDPIQHQDDIRLAFHLSSFARDGLISAAELQTFMKKVRVRKISAADSAAMIRSVDSDGDGLITFSEFQKLMTSTIFGGRLTYVQTGPMAIAEWDYTWSASGYYTSNGVQYVNSS
ncbi:hypothetical protein R1sor_010774 [Riccia sorocarpa]|uniref:EF-hand domain-containing protein n=1 Tax=Riccia sorocarpa TaxID=122646 RepID=A0ABD3HZB8_9MARC